MDELQIFSNPDFGDLRVITIDGEPWLVGREIASALGYAKPYDAVVRHVDQEDTLKRGILDARGIEQKTILINESGMYALIIMSELPTAKKFKRWVTKEIIPSVIKTGSYGLPQLSQNELILKIAESNVELEKRVDSIEQKLDTAIKVFSSPSSDAWKNDMNNIIDEMAQTYKLSPVKLRGNMYKDLEKTGVYLTSRVNRIKSRMKKHGASYRECLAVTKMDAISHDKKLMAIFEGIVKKYQATYSIKEEEL